MSPEEKELFKRSVVLAEENNDILRSLQRSMRFSRLMSLIYWVFIIGSAVGAYYFIQPYLEAIMSAYSGASTSINDLLSF
ncbi:MAG TPA: hypothetical protein VGC58_00845 [Candidatus Paceibacterota bacterium]